MAEMTEKRADYLTWDEYFMGVAMLSGMRSKDPNTQVGCCIVSQDNKILSMGYNGFPIGCSDDEFPWARDGEDPLETKYVYSTHSELNLMNAAYAVGVGSCWIHRAREVFDSQEGKALLKKWGIEGDYVGVGHCILGYPADSAAPEAKPRKEDYVVYVR